MRWCFNFRKKNSLESTIKVEAQPTLKTIITDKLLIFGERSYIIITSAFYNLQVSTALHEIMHALGMWHEQQRVDRDNYIKILKENIENPENNMVNYEKHNTANELPYDVESVLQYDLRVRIMWCLH